MNVKWNIKKNILQRKSDKRQEMKRNETFNDLYMTFINQLPQNRKSQTNAGDVMCGHEPIIKVSPVGTV